MENLQQRQREKKIIRVCSLLILFVLLGTGLFFAFMQDEGMGGGNLSQAVYCVGAGAVLAALVTLMVGINFVTKRIRHGIWFCPLTAAGLGLCLMCLAYTYLGVWPLGEKSVMMVDMHHQYAPLLCELRDMILHGGSFSYSFHVGLGTNFVPLFSYYLASPLNLLLTLFPERYLTDGILVITLIKNAFAAGAFAACAQYLYRRRNAAIILLSVCYSMTMYMLAYSWNIMWLDVVMLLPLVVMALEYLLRRGKYLPYALLLALTVFANYYIGFMLCIFLVLYFLVWMLRQKRQTITLQKGFVRFVFGSLLGGGLTAFLLVPTALALSRTSAAGGGLPDFESNFELFDLLGRLFWGSTPTIRSGNLPNLYCGVLTAFLVPLYLMQERVSLRRRLCYGGLATVMAISCTIAPLDILWHGLHSPNDLPYRFSFLVCFALLLMAGEVLTHLEGISKKAVAVSLLTGAGFLVLWEKIGGDRAPTDTQVYVNLLLLAVYAAVLFMLICRKSSVRVGRMALLLIVTAELLIGSGQTLMKLNSNEYYTKHDDYVDNDDTAADAAAIRRAQELAKEAGEVFCRMEYLPRSTCVDTALHHYNGITTFASSNPYRTALFMGHLGYAFNGVNSYLYNSFVAPVDSLFGIRYLVLDFNLKDTPYLQKVDTVTVDKETRYIYRNPYALPLGYFVRDSALTYHTTEYAPLRSQEDLFYAMTELDATVYDVLSMYTDSMTSTTTGSSFYKAADEDEAEFYATIETEGRYVAYVDCRAADDISVTTLDEDGELENDWGVTTYEPYIIDLGTLTPGQSAHARISGDGGMSGNIYIARIDDEATQTHLNALAKNALQLTEATQTHLVGTLTAPADGALLLTVPYDKGWSVTVDGEPAETFPFDAVENNKDGALLAVDVIAGTHTVELTYRVPGLRLGAAVSLISAALLVLLVLYRRKDEKSERLAAAQPTGESEGSPEESPEESPTEDAADIMQIMQAKESAPEQAPPTE